MDKDRIDNKIFIPSDEEIKNQTALIGNYIICFEQISAFLRFIILKICYPDYSKTQSNNIEILLEGLTADPLRKKLEALVYDNFPEEMELRKLNNELSKKFEKLIPIRNSIAHGSILVCYNGFDGELSSDTFLLKHSKATKTGIDRNSMIINLNSLQKLIIQARQIDGAYSQLGVLIDKDINDENKELHLDILKEKIKKIGTIELEFEKKIIK